jgi:hypothetical protein
MVVIDNDMNLEHHIRWFQGKIKNKSELRKLLEQLEIK